MIVILLLPKIDEVYQKTVKKLELIQKVVLKEVSKLNDLVMN